MSYLIKPGQTVLFQGDSITDAGRDYANPDSLGQGYPLLVKALFEADCSNSGVKFINRGISGNRVVDLTTRWDKDCIDLKPDWISILIGINEIWRKFDSNMPTPLNEYVDGYRKLLDRVANETDARLIILEPFVLHTPPDRLTWRDDLNPMIDAVRQISKDYGAIHLSLDTVFAELANVTPPETWAEDGVHPSAAGHAVIALEYLKALKS